MRKATYGGLNSLDNFIAGRDEAIDWLRWSEDSAAISATSWKGADTMLMGRKTSEFAEGMGGGPDMKGIRSCVFSRSLESVPEGVELVREDAADFVRRLKAGEGGDIVVMGGGELGAALIEAGLVDEIGLAIHPVLLGGGTPLFHAFSRRIELGLIEARPIARECVLVRYRVLNPVDGPPRSA